MNRLGLCGKPVKRISRQKHTSRLSLQDIPLANAGVYLPSSKDSRFKIKAKGRLKFLKIKFNQITDCYSILPLIKGAI